MRKFPNKIENKRKKNSWKKQQQQQNWTFEEFKKFLKKYTKKVSEREREGAALTLALLFTHKNHHLFSSGASVKKTKRAENLLLLQYMVMQV